MSRLFEDNLKKKLLHQGFWLYLFAFFIAPTSYLIKLIIAREISVEDIGIFYSIMSLIGIISTYNDMGLTEALQYFLPKYLLQNNKDSARSLIRFTWAMQFITGIVISGALYLASNRLSIHYFEYELSATLLRIFCIYFLIINLFQVLHSIFYATQQVKRAQGIEFVKMFSVLIFTVVSIFVLESFTVLHFAYYWLGGITCALIAALIGTFRLYPRIWQHPLSKLKAHLQVKEWITYGWRTMLGQSAGTLYAQINQQIVLVFLGATSAGIWAYYLSFFTIGNIVTGPIVNYLFPLLNELREKKNREKINLLFKYLTRGIIAFGLVGGVLAYFLAPRASVFLYGDAFSQSGELFKIFAPFVFTIPLIGIIFQDIASRGRVKQRVVILGGGMIASAVATYILIGKMGLEGAVYGNIIGIMVLLFLSRLVYKSSSI